MYYARNVWLRRDTPQAAIRPSTASAVRGSPPAPSAAIRRVQIGRVGLRARCEVASGGGAAAPPRRRAGRAPHAPGLQTSHHPLRARRVRREPRLQQLLARLAERGGALGSHAARGGGGRGGGVVVAVGSGGGGERAAAARRLRSSQGRTVTAPAPVPGAERQRKGQDARHEATRARAVSLVEPWLCPGSNEAALGEAGGGPSLTKGQERGQEHLRRSWRVHGLNSREGRQRGAPPLIASLARCASQRLLRTAPAPPPRASRRLRSATPAYPTRLPFPCSDAANHKNGGLAAAQPPSPAACAPLTPSASPPHRPPAARAELAQARSQPLRRAVLRPCAAAPRRRSTWQPPLLAPRRRALPRARPSPGSPSPPGAARGPSL